MPQKKTVVIALLGTTLDQGKGPDRWSRWRPTIAMCQQEDLVIDRLELLYPRRYTALAEIVTADLARVSPETEVVGHPTEFDDAWDLEEVYGGLLDFARRYDFRPEREDYLVHITTGTHIAQISLFLLAEARFMPARLLQTSPPNADAPGPHGRVSIIDLDLSKYDRIASRFRREQREGLSHLKLGIDTKSPAFNTLIDRIERVAVSSADPILLIGPTGSGKTQLARRIYELKKAKRQLDGELVVVNCATMRGEGAMTTLFGHVKGAFAGAEADRPGLLMRADDGLLFMDDIAELGATEQAMLLRALEDRSFYPVGGDRENRSEFQLIAAADRDLVAADFREDLLARINLWTFHLPGLRERPEDVAPNLDYELEQCARVMNLNVRIEDKAREKFLRFAASPAATWPGNFRDFAAAVRRMATLAPGGTIGLAEVEGEIALLRDLWRVEAPLPLATPAPAAAPAADEGWIEKVLGPDQAADLDDFDRVQLAEVLRVCHAAPSLSEAGRQLFSVSRGKKKVANDADRLRKYLARFGIDWKDIKAGV